MGCENIVQVFFHMTTTIKLYHWQTQVYSRHVATDGLLTQLHQLIDQFVETYIGRYRRPDFGGKLDLEIEELTESSAQETLKYYIRFLKTKVPMYLKEDDTDLLNIRDEIVGVLNRTLYLFTLH
ncbi:MAG: hypothetical protein EBU90_04740 [Proteobacteria bacterium]|nr:hypothetical protein [Pseudomonadota bacterium]NBP13775.1 hypothetical protein [bacterium]